MSTPLNALPATRAQALQPRVESPADIFRPRAAISNHASSSAGERPAPPGYIQYPRFTPDSPAPTGKPPRRQRLVIGLLVAIALLCIIALGITVLFTYNTWKHDRAELAALAATLTATPTSTENLTTPQPTLLSQSNLPSSDSTGASLLAQARVSSLQGEVFRASAGSFVLLSLHESLVSPTGLMSGPKSGVYIELIADSSSSSYAYLFFDSTLNLIYDTALTPQLIEGRLYLQPGAEDAEIHLPNHQNVIARIQGSAGAVNPNRMLVETINSDLWIWCLRGVCSLENEAGVSTYIQPMTKRLYHAATGTFEPGLPITAEALWTWQVSCAYLCLTGFVTPPDFSTTATPTGTTTQTTLAGSATPTPRVILPTATLPPTDPNPPALTPTPTKTLAPYPPVITVQPPSPTPTPAAPPYPYPASQTTSGKLIPCTSLLSLVGLDHWLPAGLLFFLAAYPGARSSY